MRVFWGTRFFGYFFSNEKSNTNAQRLVRNESPMISGTNLAYTYTL